MVFFLIYFFKIKKESKYKKRGMLFFFVKITSHFVMVEELTWILTGLLAKIKMAQGLEGVRPNL